MSVDTKAADPVVPIEDPEFYTTDPWPTFAWMRRERPFYYYAPLDTFVVTRQRDIHEITDQADVFVNSRGLFLADIKYASQSGDAGVTNAFFPEGGEQVGTTDAPRHHDLRRVIMPAFSVAAMEEVQVPVAAQAAALLDGVTPGTPVDWMELAAQIPITAACHLIGLPATDHGRVQFWSDELEKLGGDLTLEQIQAAAAEFQSLQAYITEQVELKKSGPVTGKDLLSVLLTAELDGKTVSHANVVMFAMTALAAGGDTSRSMLGGLVHCFAEHPDQWDLLRKDRSLLRNAVEEVLRWVTPARAFVRTAIRDITVGGQAIREGQHVYLLYMAANRDEAAFEDADRFDITREDTAKHMAFGAGPHACAGSRLARMQGRAVLEALLDRFSRIELAGPATPVRGHLIRNSWTSMPAVFSR